MIYLDRNNTPDVWADIINEIKANHPHNTSTTLLIPQ